MSVASVAGSLLAPQTLAALQPPLPLSPGGPVASLSLNALCHPSPAQDASSRRSGAVLPAPLGGGLHGKGRPARAKQDGKPSAGATLCGLRSAKKALRTLQEKRLPSTRALPCFPGRAFSHSGCWRNRTFNAPFLKAFLTSDPGSEPFLKQNPCKPCSLEQEKPRYCSETPCGAKHSTVLSGDAATGSRTPAAAQPACELSTRT